ncbi:MAG: META domain-containing protein [Methylococcaceae bacterium]|nr:META domain-containing protein [Methylococcaceae bacterium]
MKSNKLSALIVSMILVLDTACSSIPSGNITESSQSVANRILTENDLANAIYEINGLGRFQLDKGEFNRQYGEGMTQRHKVTLEKVAFGDLDHDGVSDGAVILAWQSGGSGTFKYLSAMRNIGNSLRQQDSILLGDRVHISALSIHAGEVDMEAITTGSHDPACCASQQVKQTYILRDGKWTQRGANIAESAKITASNPNIFGTVWKWVRFESASKSHDFVIDDPNKYTLILLQNGSYQAKADCNRMQGQFTLEDRRIKIESGATTLAECPPGSRYADYLKYLTEAISFALHEHQVELRLMTNGQSLVFEKGGEVPQNHPH